MIMIIDDGRYCDEWCLVFFTIRNSSFFFCFVSIHYDDDDDGGDYFRSIQLLLQFYFLLIA